MIGVSMMSKLGLVFVLILLTALVGNAHATTTLGLDGVASSSGSGTSRLVSLTTNSANDVIIVSVTLGTTGSTIPTVTGITDTAGLSYNLEKRTSGGGNFYGIGLEEWYAIAPNALSSDVANIVVSSSTDISAVSFGVSGANTVTPFDSNAMLPASSSGSTKIANVLISTSNPNDFIFALTGYNTDTTGSGTDSTSLTNIRSQFRIGNFADFYTDAQYHTYGSTQNHLNVTYTNSQSNYVVHWEMIGSAIQLAPNTLFVALSPSTLKFDVGQSISLTANIAGSPQPFNAVFQIVNSVNPALVINTITVNGISSNGYTYAYQFIQADVYNSPEDAIVTVTNSSGITTNSMYTQTFTITNTISIPSITQASAQSYDQGQLLNFTAQISGGNPPYTYNFLITNSVTNALITSYLHPNSKTINSTTFWIPSNWVGNTIQANVIVTDATGVSKNSIESGTMTIYSAFSTNSVSISNSIQSITANVIGGTPPYTYNYLIYNSINSLVANALYTSNSPSNTFIISPTLGIGTYTSNVTVVDSSNGLIRQYSLGSWTQTANSPGHSISGEGALGCVTNSSYAYCIGQSSNTIVDTFYAHLSSTGGIIGNWVNTTSYPITSMSQNTYALGTWCGVYSNKMFCVGGNYNGINLKATNSVYFAPISSSGIGAWTSTTPYPETVLKEQCVINNGYIYCVGGENYLDSSSYSNAYYAPISSSGIGAWTSTTSYPISIRSFACEPYANNIECAGGLVSGISPSYYASLSSSGIGTWKSTTPYNLTLPSDVDGTASHVGWASDGRNFFIIGDWNTQDAPLSVTGVSQLMANGISVWTPTTNYPTGTAYPGCFESTISGNTFLYCVAGIDGSRANTTKVYYAPVITQGSNTTVPNTQSFSIYSTLNAGAITPTSPKIDSGQTITLTANPSGGTPSYSYAWYTGAGCTSQIGGANSQNYAPSPTSTTTYYYQVTDSASTSLCSSGDTVTVSSALGTPSILPSASNKYDFGQSISFSTSVGGTQPYTYNWIITNSVTGTQIANQLYTSSSSSNAFVWSFPSIDAGNTIQANVIVTDSAYSAVTANSIKSGTETLYSVLGIPTLTASNTPTITNGQYEVFTAQWSGGASTYTANYQVINSVSGALLANALYTGISGTGTVSNTFTWLVPSIDLGNTITANVIVTDSATTPTSANSVNLATITISLATGTLVATPNPYTWTNGTINIGQISQGSTTLSNGAVGTTSYNANVFVTPPASSHMASGNTITFALPSSNTLTFTLNAISPTSMKLTTNGGTATYFNTIGTNVITGIWTVNAYGNDASGDLSPSPVLSNTLTVDSQLVASSAPSATYPTIDNGQSTTLSISAPSTGTSPYTYLWYSGASSTCLSDSATAQTGLSYLVSPTANTFYCVQETDSASTNSIVYTGTTQVTVDTAMSGLSLTVSNTPLIDTSEYETFSSSWSGGTPNFQANYIITNTVSGGILTSHLNTGITGQSDSWTYQIPSAWAGNTIAINVILTDGASNAVTINTVKSSTITVNAMPSVSSIAPSASNKYDFGQSIPFTVSISGGTPPYTYNWLVVNTVSGALIGNYLTSNSYTSNAFTWAFSYPNTNNAVQANVIITDSANTPVTINSIKSGTETLSTDLGVPTITASNTPYVSPNQWELFTATLPAGDVGTSTYTYNFIITNTVTGTQLANALYSGVSGTANTFFYQIPSTWGGNTITANVMITDSATTPTKSNSIKLSTITVTASPVVSITAPSNSVVDVGQYEYFIATVTNGATPYTYNFMVVNSITNIVVANQIYTSVGGATQSYTFQITSPNVANSPEAVNVVVKDNTPNTYGSSYSATYTIHASQVAGALTESNQIIDVGQYSLLTANPSLGSPSYTINWFNAANCGGSNIGSGSTLLVNPSTNTVYSYNSVDSATTKNVVCSSSNSITVRADPTVSTPTPSNTLLDFGQYVIYNAILTGTGSSFTVNLIYLGNTVSSLTGQSAGNLFFVANIPAQGTDSFNVIATDMGTNTPYVFNSPSNVITVNPIVTGSVTPASPQIDVGQAINLYSNPSGGTGAYSYQWYYSYTSTPCEHTISGATSNMLSAGPGVTTTYYSMVTDSASTPTSICLSGDAVTVNPALGTPTISVISGNYNAGQTVTFNALATGGTPSYTYAWKVSNSITHAVVNTITSASNSFVFTIPSNLVANTLVANVTVTDSSQSVHETANSAYSGVITVTQLYTLSLAPKYTYRLSGSHVNATANSVFNLLNFSYSLNVTSVYGINTIAISFGANALPANVFITANSQLAYNAILWNLYQNNNLNSYNAVITVNDVHGNSFINIIVIPANTYVYSGITRPTIYLTSSPATSTYTAISTPIRANITQGSFPIANIIFYVDGVNTVQATIPNIPPQIMTPTAVQISYTYPYVINPLTINDMVTDINGFSGVAGFNSVTGDSVLSYTPGTVTFTGGTIYELLNESFPFSVTAGTFQTSKVEILWGDGNSTTYTFNSPVSSGTFTLHHIYGIPQTYVLTAYSTDNSPLGGVTVSALTNPTLAVSYYSPPVVSSVMPNNRFNGANDNTENFTFYTQEGSFPLKNMTVNWNDATSVTGNKATNTFTTLTATQLTFSVVHTFVLPNSYKSNATICDTLGACFTYPTYLSVGMPAPLSPSAVNALANSTSRANNQSLLNNNPTYNQSQDPGLGIGVAAVISAAFITALLWFMHSHSKNPNVRRRRQDAEERKRDREA